MEDMPAEAIETGHEGKRGWKRVVRLPTYSVASVPGQPAALTCRQHDPNWLSSLKSSCVNT